MSSARPLSSSKLSKELQEALQADAKRQVLYVLPIGRPICSLICSIPKKCVWQAIDSAKKRAVGQHVDYETFKNMVS